MQRRFSAFRPAAFDHGEPIARIVLGPVAGVLLVACAVLMLGLPQRTHAIIIRFPPPGSVNFEPWITPPLVDTISLSRDGQLGWNGIGLNKQELISRIVASREEVPSTGLIFDPADDAAYGQVMQVLGLLHSLGATNYGFCLAGPLRNRLYELPPDPRPPAHSNPGHRNILAWDDECVDAILLPPPLVDTWGMAPLP